MFSLYFLDPFINMVKYLQIVPLDVSINWCYLHQDAGKTYSEISKIRSAGIWKRKAKHCLTEEKYLTTNQSLARRVFYFFVKRVVVKVGIPPSISEETVRRVLQ